nr:DUF1353 domain-containing protein [uncultured Arsenicibacter sp.]
MNLIQLHSTRFERHLRVDIFGGLKKRDQFVLLEPVMIELPDRQFVTVEAGYVSDGASVPPWLWSIFPPYDNVVMPAYVVHDWLYEYWEKTGLTQDDARKYADLVMLQLCLRYDPVKTLKHLIFYAACRIGGVNNWRTFRKRAAQP